MSSMIVQRLLAGNVFEHRQRRFRNMKIPDPLDFTIRYTYRIEELWTYQLTGIVGSAVSCFTWCPVNSDLLAIGYGVYDYQVSSARNAGYVAVWSMKNPRNPERNYRFTEPVTAVAFSKVHPHLLAIGTFIGCIFILDITDSRHAITMSLEPLASSPRGKCQGLEPIWDIIWMRVGMAEEMITVAESGLVIKYSLTNSPNLIGLRQIRLNRVDGCVKGLTIPYRRTQIRLSQQQQYANLHSQAVVVQAHPIRPDVFYVGTDDGFLHKCSLFIPHQFADILRVHRGSVTSIEFSPWSAKIFLTSGSDWKIRIWVEDVNVPVLELCSSFEAVRCASWSPIHSTVLVCLTKQHIELWNIRKNIIRPASVTNLYAGNVALTTCSFSPCGRLLIIGDADGVTHMCALEDMPFAPYFPFLELQAAIDYSLVTKPELLRLVKCVGFLGYANGTKIPD